jgi:hypothetical protein
MLNALGRPGPADPRFGVDCSGAGLATYPDTSSVGPGGSGGSGGSGSTGSGGSAGRVRLVIGHVSGHGGSRRLRVALAASGGTVRGVSLTLRGAHGDLLARARGMTISRRRVVALRLSEPLEREKYKLLARGRDSSGRAVSATRPFILRG